MQCYCSPLYEKITIALIINLKSFLPILVESVPSGRPSQSFMGIAWRTVKLCLLKSKWYEITPDGIFNTICFIKTERVTLHFWFVGLLLSILSCSSTITGLCYVRPTKTIWVAAGTPEAPMYDPKSGDNVSFCSKVTFSFLITTRNNVFSIAIKTSVSDKYVQDKVISRKTFSFI